MNKLTLIIIGLFLFADLPISAAAFLVCDPYEAAVGVDKFEVTIVKIRKKQSSEEVVHKDEHPPDSTGQYGLKLNLDILNLADGSYKATAKAHNAAGWSKPASCTFSLPHN